MGLIICAQKDEAVAGYALEGLPNKVMASGYRTALPDEKELAPYKSRQTRALLENGTANHSTKGYGYKSLNTWSTEIEPFIGIWSIIEMEAWDQECVDMEVPGHFTSRKRLGTFWILGWSREK